MRKFFASAFGVSLTAALVLGAAFAWSASTTGNFNSGMGTVSIGFWNYAPSGLAIYDGAGYTVTETGNFQNLTPANPGLNLQLTSGSISGISASGCQTWMGGDVLITDSSMVAPGGNVGGGWAARLYISGSPDVCQGVGVNYNVNLVAGS